ncbi:MAG: hypothetical protein Q8R82_15395 [Hyphomonadaceae bacterium]|nr:hypothetical protein [Hyphomonadaceae bacterium]
MQLNVAQIIDRSPVGAAFIAERTIVNVQLTYAQGRWSVQAFGANIFDKLYVAGVQGTAFLHGAPRQYGVRISRDF